MYFLTTIKLPVRLVDQNLEIFEYYNYHYWYVYKYITDDISLHSIPHILGPVMSSVGYGLLNLLIYIEIVAQELWKTV